MFVHFQMSPSYIFPGREGDILGSSRGKLVAMAKKKMSMGGKTKVKVLLSVGGNCFPGH